MCIKAGALTGQKTHSSHPTASMLFSDRNVGRLGELLRNKSQMDVCLQPLWGQCDERISERIKGLVEQH